METLEAIFSRQNAMCTSEGSLLDSTGNASPNLQSLPETLLEELEGCVGSEDCQVVHESGQELGHSHDVQEDSRILHVENQLLREARTCKVCRVAEVSVVILPCGHLVCCAQCIPTLPHCPACQQKIRGTVRTFLN